MSIAVGALAAVVGTVLSWTKFASYDSLATNHKIAYGRFYGTCSSIEILFLQLKRVIADVDRDVVLETLDSILLETENDGNGVNNEGDSGMVSDKSDKSTSKEDKDTHLRKTRTGSHLRKTLMLPSIQIRLCLPHYACQPHGRMLLRDRTGRGRGWSVHVEELLEPQTKMQLILKAFQYRIFNAMGRLGYPFGGSMTFLRCC